MGAIARKLPDNPQPETGKSRVAAQPWKGFHFSGIHDPELAGRFEDSFC